VLNVKSLELAVLEAQAVNVCALFCFSVMLEHNNNSPWRSAVWHKAWEKGKNGFDSRM
jgi:hypothetical protein